MVNIHTYIYTEENSSPICTLIWRPVKKSEIVQCEKPFDDNLMAEPITFIKENIIFKIIFFHGKSSWISRQIIFKKYFLFRTGHFMDNPS